MFSLLLQGLNYSKRLEGFKIIFVTLLLSTYLLVLICTEDERPLFAPIVILVHGPGQTVTCKRSLKFPVN
jgi:hypothetical protein